MFYLYNSHSRLYAHRDSKGQHDDMVTTKIEDAVSFDTFGEASDYSQNFSSNWTVDSYGYDDGDSDPYGMIEERRRNP